MVPSKEKKEGILSMKRLLLSILLVLAIALIGIISYLTYSFQGVQRSGTIQVPGLTSTVDVYFDKWGIPHIEGETSQDVFFALGFVQAQDRILQMDATRRLAQGRLSEVIGDATIELDRMYRTIGIDRYSKVMAEKADRNAPYIQHMQAYLDGINAFVSSGRMPLEAKILPEMKPFTLQDMYAVAGYMTFSFDRGLKDEIIRYRTLNKLDPKRYAHLFPKRDAPQKAENLDLPSEYLKWASVIEEYMDRIGRLEGSNSLVVGAAKSKTGNALLANDTHIKFSNPGVWYEAELSAPGLSIYGHFLPVVGTPLLGHNESHGWAVTIFHNDDIDIILEQPGKAKDTIVRYQQEIPLKKHTTTIHRRSGNPLTFEDYDTDIGPDIRRLVGSSSPTSLRWGFYQQRRDSLEGFYELIFADTTEKAKEAVYGIDSPSLNISYANKSGDIAWWTSGRIKKSLNSFFEFIPKEDHPQEINPERGYIFSTNNKYSEDALGQYTIEQRAQRLQFLLDQSQTIGIEELKSHHKDDKIDYHYKHIAIIKRALDKSGAIHPASHEAFLQLENWKDFMKRIPSAPRYSISTPTISSKPCSSMISGKSCLRSFSNLRRHC